MTGLRAPGAQVRYNAGVRPELPRVSCLAPYVAPCLALWLVGPAAAEPSTQLVVPTVQLSGVDAAAAPVITELVLEALLVRHGLPALGPADLKDLLTVEQQKQLIGCDEGKCMAELAGALGSGRVVSGMVGRLGDTVVLTLKLIDATSAQVVARASRSVARVEAVRDVVGPVVDELLGQKPRAETAVPRLVERRKAEEKARGARDVASFCGALVDAYLGELGGDAGPARLLDARRGLLDDLWFTPYFAELDQKLACLKARGPERARQSTRRRLAALGADEAARAQLADREWRELEEALGVLVEAYKLGAEKERLGTGARADTLPLVLRLARAPARAATQEAEARYQRASVVLATALAAVARADKAGFVATFERQPRRDDPRDVYVELLRQGERARLDVCPAWALEDLALRTAAPDTVRLCLRRVPHDGSEVTLTDLDAVGGGTSYKLLAAEPSRSR